jgi:hypothetical protein
MTTTRRWLVSTLSTLALVVTAALPAGAQEVVTRDEGAGKVTLWGDICLTWVCRDEVFEAVFPRRGPFRIKPNDEIFGDFAVTIGLDATLKRKFGGRVLLETNADPYGGENHRMGDNLNDFLVEEAFLYANDFFYLGLELRIGVQNVTIKFRETRSRGSFFLDLHGSEDPFTGAVHTASTVGGTSTGVNPSQSGVPNPLTPGGIGIPFASGYPQPVNPDPTVSESGFNPYLGGNAWISNFLGQSKRSEFGGAVFTYEGMFDLMAFLGTTMESGTARADTQLAGFTIAKRFKAPMSEEDSVVRLTYTAFTSGGPIAVHSGGFAVDIWTAGDRFNAYGEFVGQMGVYTSDDRAGIRDHTPQKSFAWYSGGRIELPFADLGLSAGTAGQNVYIDSSFWYLSGDDGNPFQSNKDFVSYESVSDALIIEGSTYGFDFDTNYHAVKIEAGVNLEWMNFSVFWGQFFLNKAPLGNGGGSANVRQRLGNEIDIRLRFTDFPVENVELGVALAFLFQSDFLPGIVRERNQLDPNLPAEQGHLQRSKLLIVTVKVHF